MVRGIDRRPMVRDARDRADFVGRLAALTGARTWTVYAWALLPNHLHLLLRTGRRPLARSMGALLAGYAGAVNRRHNRHGHLFQHWYIHLNPLRAGVVRDLAALDRYRWAGHSLLQGKRRQPWQAVDAAGGKGSRVLSRGVQPPRLIRGVMPRQLTWGDCDVSLRRAGRQEGKAIKATTSVRCRHREACRWKSGPGSRQLARVARGRCEG